MSINEALYEERESLPVRDIWRLNQSISWAVDNPCDYKAYIMACFSELAYLAIDQYDLKCSSRLSRFKVVQSQSLEMLVKDRKVVDLAEALGYLDMQPTIIRRDKFLYLLLRIYDTLIVAVRGTHQPRDWAINLAAPPQFRRSTAGLHLGFLNEAKEALPHLVASVPVGAKYIYCTGHSLGGAVASVLAQEWADHRVKTAYTFGAPRFGNEKAVSRRRPFAFVKSNDIVPHVPPRIYGYSDAEDPLRAVPRSNEIKSGREVAFIWLAASRRLVVGGPFAVEHSIERYRRLMGLQLATATDFPELAYFQALRQAYGS